MKGGVAAMLAAIRAVARSGTPLRRSVALHLVSAEEDGGAGAYSALRRGHRGEACIIAEPTAGKIVSANAGSLTFAVTVPGQAAHGAMAAQGVNALECLDALRQELAELGERRRRYRPEPFAQVSDPWPMSLGVIRGGQWASTVLDELVVEGRFGVRPDETVAEAREVFEEAARRASVRHPLLAKTPLQVRWPGGIFEPGALAAGHPLTDWVRRAITAANDAPAPDATGAPYGSDLRLYARAGIPTLQYGPGDIRWAHVADEWVAEAELLSSARTYAQLILARCA